MSQQGFLDLNEGRAYPFTVDAATGVYQEVVVDLAIRLGDDLPHDLTDESLHWRLREIALGSNGVSWDFKLWQHDGSSYVSGTELVVNVGTGAEKFSTHYGSTAGHQSHAYLTVADISKIVVGSTPEAPIEQRTVIIAVGTEGQSVVVYNARRRQPYAPSFVADPNNSPGTDYANAKAATGVFVENVVEDAGESVAGPVIPLVSGYNCRLTGDQAQSLISIILAVGEGLGQKCESLPPDLRAFTKQGALRTLNGQRPSNGELMLRNGRNMSVQALPDQHKIKVVVGSPTLAGKCPTGKRSNNTPDPLPEPPGGCQHPDDSSASSASSRSLSTASSPSTQSDLSTASTPSSSSSISDQSTATTESSPSTQSDLSTASTASTESSSSPSSVSDVSTASTLTTESSSTQSDLSTASTASTLTTESSSNSSSVSDQSTASTASSESTPTTASSPSSVSDQSTASSESSPSSPSEVTTSSTASTESSSSSSTPSTASTQSEVSTSSSSSLSDVSTSSSSVSDVSSSSSSPSTATESSSSSSTPTSNSSVTESTSSTITESTDSSQSSITESLSSQSPSSESLGLPNELLTNRSWDVNTSGWTYNDTPTVNAMGGQWPAPISAGALVMSTSATSAEAYQDVDVSTWADEIDDGALECFFAGYNCHRRDRYHQVRFLVEFRNASSTVIDSMDTGYGSPSNYVWMYRTLWEPVPANTRTIRVRILFFRNSGTGMLAAADFCTLRLREPDTSSSSSSSTPSEVSSASTDSSDSSASPISSSTSTPSTESSVSDQSTSSTDTTASSVSSESSVSDVTTSSTTTTGSTQSDVSTSSTNSTDSSEGG